MRREHMHCTTTHFCPWPGGEAGKGGRTTDAANSQIRHLQRILKSMIINGPRKLTASYLTNKGQPDTTVTGELPRDSSAESGSDGEGLQLLQARVEVEEIGRGLRIALGPFATGRATAVFVLLL